jgi:triphosphoribosyl-dephospho-CoA synthase
MPQPRPILPAPEHSAWGRGRCVAEACRLEATARKPGNVHPDASFPDLDHSELVAAGVAIAPAMEAAPCQRLGRTILGAVEASRRVTRSNANLGIVLAIAPLAAVGGEGAFHAADATRLLSRLTPEDAADTWTAIGRAAPGGMGRRPEMDVAGPAPDDLLAAMAAAAPHDRIARLWTEGWQPLFDGLVVDLLDELGAGMTLGEAIVRGYLRQLAREPDTLIARRHGADTAAAVSCRAGEVLSQGARGWRGAANDFDRELRSPKRINPGTTADLCATALYILLRDGRLCDRLGGNTDLAMTARAPGHERE